MALIAAFLLDIQNLTDIGIISVPEAGLADWLLLVVFGLLVRLKKYDMGKRKRI